MGNEFQMLVYGETIVKFQARTWKSAAGPSSLHLPFSLAGGHILSIGDLWRSLLTRQILGPHPPKSWFWRPKREPDGEQNRDLTKQPRWHW